MKAVVYILGFRSQSRVDRLLKSIDDNYPDRTFDVWVCDNDPGGSQPLEAPNLIIGKGGGFTPGFNGCLRHALSHYSNECVPIILNDDLEIEPEFIERMIAPIEEDGYGIVAPMQVDMENPSIVICGGFGVALPSGQHRSGLRGDPGIVSGKSKWVTFCAVAINPSTITDIGLLDENMAMYYSDSDYCARASDAGWLSWFEAKAVVRHENHGATAEFLGQDKSVRQLLFDKWVFDTKWGERIVVPLTVP